MREGLGFDDVLLVPKKSSLSSRKNVNTETYLTRNIRIAIPIVSANMLNVTEHRMAIAMAQLGGIGIIHRFMSIEEQIEEVKKVKRWESIVIDDPYTIGLKCTVEMARRMMSKFNVSGLIVCDKRKKLIGIVTRRDVLFEDMKTKIKDVMTPIKDLVYAKYGIDIEDAIKLMHKNRIEKLPLIDERGIVRGLITMKDIEKSKAWPNATKDKKGRLSVGAAIGVKKGFMERSEKLIEVGTDVIVVDIAHGHSDLAINTVKELRKEFGDKIEIIAGNVATANGTKDLINVGVDAVKVGIGSGSICTTRIITGCGVPQITAIIDCSKIGKKEGIPIIADGGIKSSGDVVKALASGASSVMLGSMLAGTDESPGITVMRNARKYKFYKGMASVRASIERAEREHSQIDEELIDYVPEGMEAFVLYKGSVFDIIRQIVGGLRSGMSYCGARNIKELQSNAEFIKVRSHIKETLPDYLEFT